jgi:hypothetical protein
MNENEIGYRGSKSEIKNPNPKIISVKEQRVDGSYFINLRLIKLRCTLMGFGRSYQINNLSKQIKNNFSTLQSNIQLNPYWITGFTDAEGTFTIVMDKVNNRKLGWRIQARFQKSLHIRDLPLLFKIQQFFLGKGSLSVSGDMAIYSVSGIKDLIKIIVPHFTKYPLFTQK